METKDSGFDIVGSAAIIKIPPDLKKKDELLLAKRIVLKNKHIDRVFKKASKIEGKERIAKLIWIYGKKGTLVLHKENGYSFYVDIKKVFFTPRLGSERLRISKLEKDGESILDMFCGVGPYSILLAKKANEIHSIDINRNAIALMKRNLQLNKINNVKIYNGDSKKIVKTINKKFDRIVMNFPLAAKDFLGAALTAANKNCVIHLYSFLNVVEGYDLAVKAAIKNIRTLIPRQVTIRKINAIRAGEVAPYLIRECFDIYLQMH